MPASAASPSQDAAAATEAERLLHQARTLSQRVATFSTRISLETATLSEEVERVADQINKALAAASHAEAPEGPQGPSPPSSLEVTPRVPSWVDQVVTLESAKAVIRGHGPGGDLRKFLKSRRPTLLGLFLGKSANVVCVRRDEAIRVKQEYHAFRNRSAYTMLAFSALLYAGVLRSRRVAEAGEPLTLLPLVLVGVQLFLCWLLFFYTASALRESVLKVNGSHIRQWWIHHHYWAGGMCVLMLSLPVDSPSFVHAITIFLVWGMMQALVILLQNRYQKRRMYTRIALGKSSAMDVVAGESSGADADLLVLYPMLFAVQALQGYIGVEMMKKGYMALLSTEGFLDPEHKESDLWGSRGVALAGVLMTYMASKNFFYTMTTAVSKRVAQQKALTRIKALRSRSQPQGTLGHLRHVSPTVEELRGSVEGAAPGAFKAD